MQFLNNVEFIYYLFSDSNYNSITVLFKGVKDTEVLSKLKQGYRHPEPTNCPDDLYDMMLKCWNENQEKRPTFEKLYNFLEDMIFGF